MNNGILWSIGALSPPLAEQAAGFGYTLKNAELHQTKIDYLVYLRINDVLTESQYEKAICRVIEKHIPKDLVRAGEENAAD
ncbi:MAG: hypothetical protein IJN57_03920 [Oscillospiraceae bacterium]|nr:hypothetical protein [Oscillospiraceae bacterium]